MRLVATIAVVIHKQEYTALVTLHTYKKARRYSLLPMHLSTYLYISLSTTGTFPPLRILNSTPKAHHGWPTTSSSIPGG